MAKTKKLSIGDIPLQLELIRELLCDLEHRVNYHPICVSSLNLIHAKVNKIDRIIKSIPKEANGHLHEI